MPSPSSDGRFVAFVSERDGRNRIWLKQLDTGGEEPLTEGVDISPRFSPDGGSVLFLRADGDRQSLYRRGLVGGEARKLADDVAEACWSPDGQMIGILRILSEGELPLFSVGTVDLRTREERELARTDHLLYGLQWSPDGRVLSAGESPLTGMSVGASRLTLFWTAGALHPGRQLCRGSRRPAITHRQVRPGDRREAHAPACREPDMEPGSGRTWCARLSGPSFFGSYTPPSPTLQGSGAGPALSPLRSLQE